MIKGILIVLIIALITFFALKSYKYPSQTSSSTSPSITDPTRGSDDTQPIKIIATNLEVPWALDWLPDKRMLVTERSGQIDISNSEGKLQPFMKINDVYQVGEGGLLGIAVHPDFTKKPFVYVYYTYQGNGDNTLNKVVRYQFKNDTLTEPKVLLDSIPGSSNHNGGRVKFGPDKQLYVTTGDAENPSQAQDKNSLAGKILRMTDEGKPTTGNPFDNYTYSYGHRNPQGLAWDAQGALWETEHGPSGAETGNDELNTIQPGRNYGWPTIRGTQKKEGMESPQIESGFLHTWAPSGLAFNNGRLFFAGLRGTKLYVYDISSKQLTEHLDNQYGRLRESIIGPDEYLYLTTSNRDGRGIPKNEDDKVIRLDINSL